MYMDKSEIFALIIIFGILFVGVYVYLANKDTRIKMRDFNGGWTQILRTR